jgi:poly-gamma-glutamate synthesis protein (capsule biosynthesis protein)
LGIGRNSAEARRPVILFRHGIKVAFLGYGGVKDYIASYDKPGTTSRNEGLILNDIKKLRSRVDFVVVNLHWGDESAVCPDSDQITLAHTLIDGGADLIIGHHPHVLQGIEKYNGKIIAYSLGNFVFGGNAKSMNSETAVLKVRFAKSKIDVQAVPILVHNWQPSPADSVAADRIFRLLEERSKVFIETISFTSIGAKYE